MFWGNDVIEYINERLQETWSPEQIANAAAPVKTPSFKTI